MSVELPYQPLYTTGEGDPIVLLHGPLAHLSNWKTVIIELAISHRILVPRLPFYSDPISKKRLDELVDYLDCFIKENAFSDKVTLLCNSLGGHIGLLYAWQQPKKVRRIVLAGSSGLYENSLGDSFPYVKEYDQFQGKVESVNKVLHQISMPTLLIWGLQDTITPPEIALEFHDLLPNSKVVFLENCGHTPMIEQPEYFNKHVRSFLKTIAPNGTTKSNFD